MNRIARRALVHGVVQGVGFRPFVYRIAHQRGLAGSVRNLGDAGVEIIVEGSASDVSSFLAALTSEAPVLARLDGVDLEELAVSGTSSFVILPSREDGDGAGQIPPDVATCDACAAEIQESSRFQGYWATSCTDCGPRFTVIESLPYDRPRTSMSEFPLCPLCHSEYHNPLDRRYHAQTTACATCGPALEFDADPFEALSRALDALEAGRIVAIKGIGGTHIACDAQNEETVARLRARLGRPTQPFAVMGLESALGEWVELSDEERRELRKPHRPILVAKKNPDRELAGVAPGLHTLGVMLPYSGLHHLLFEAGRGPLVMTSANRPGRPMLIRNDQIVSHLSGIVDHCLLHNRRIVARCDDSVQRMSVGGPVLLRRSRGLVPEGFEQPWGDEPILALGPESDLTFAVYDRGRVTLSQHIGTVDDLETLEALQDAVAHLSRITRARRPSIIACDAHPRFLTTQWAEETAEKTGARVVRVQHHAAHLAAVMAENRIERCVGIILDGYGYGLDGGAWGGEVLAADEGRLERVGSLSPVPLPGGDLAAKHPLRVAASLLLAAGRPPEEVLRDLTTRGMPSQQAGLVLRQVERNINAPASTSAGRFLDAVAAWLGVCRVRGYEGEPAMRLEAVASRGRPHPLALSWTTKDEVVRIDVADLFVQLTRLATQVSVADVAATAQVLLAQGVAALAIRAATQRGIDSIALSGGVAYNHCVATHIADACTRAGFSFLLNRLVPCGDGGISLGQAAYVGLGLGWLSPPAAVV